MQYVVLDSNIFFDHWHLNNAEFRMLADFIKNSQSVLLISEIVCSEVDNLYDREQKKVISELEKNYEKALRFNNERKSFNLEGLIEPYDFKKVIQEKVEFVEFYKYDTIPHSVVVGRAIGNILPFRDKEKGYRDTMIWLSLLDYLKSKSKNDHVFFISRNSSDYYSSDKQNLHEILKHDLAEQKINCTITVFSSLNAFIKDKVETNELEFSNESISDKYLDLIPRVIESEVEWYFNLMQTYDFKKLLDSTRILFRYASSLIYHVFEIDEGIEDGEVVSYKRLSSNTLYINYQFNLRRCTIELVIPLTEYLQHQFGIDVFYNNSYLEEDKAHLFYYCRPDFQVSFVYDIEKKTIDGFELLSLDFRVLEKK